MTVSCGVDSGRVLVLIVVGYRCDYMPVSCGVDSGRVQV